MPDRRNKGNTVQESGKFMSSVKVGPKGQVVIPKEAREMFGIMPGDTLLLLADISRGIALQRLNYFDKIADEIFLKAGSDSDSSPEREAGLKFAKAVKTIQNHAEEKPE